MNITAKENTVLKTIRDDDYHDGAGPLSTVWSTNLKIPEGMTQRSMGGIMASLHKKGLVDLDGSGKDSTVAPTQAGFDSIV